MLPEIASDDLGALPDEIFWKLMDRERRLVDWALLMHTTLVELCGPEINRQVLVDSGRTRVLPD